MSTDDRGYVENFEWVARFFSDERFSKYLAETSGDYCRALDSYSRDMFALGELHIWINILEVSLRNAMVRELQNSAQLETTDWLTKRVISLPIHTELDEEQQAFIVSAVIEYINR